MALKTTDDDDPFLSVQADVISTLTETRSLFSSYLRIRSHAATSASTKPGLRSTEELRQTRKDVETNLDALTADVQDLVASIAAVENDPYAFGIDTAEVLRRRQFVADVNDEVGAMRRELFADDGNGNGGGRQNVASTSAATHAAGGASGAMARLPPPDAFDEDEAAHNNNNHEHDPDAYAAFEQEQQQMILAEQDQQLDGVYRSVGVLRGQAEDMGRELEEQEYLINEVDTLADRVGGKLQVGVRKVGDVIRKNEDTWSSCCIGVLILVLIILLVLLIVI